MKIIFTIIFTLLFFVCCRKTSENNSEMQQACTNATVTLNASPCLNKPGLIINNVTYPTENLDSSFFQEGKQVCVLYKLYQDERLCPCCGGRWIDILKVVL